MKALVACERSGTVRDALIRHGWDAISCDIQESIAEGPHYCGDVMDILYEPWDMIIAHPPCTFSAHSGVQHLWDESKKPEKVKVEERWEKMRKGVEFFNIFRDHPCKKKCIEQPILHGYAIDLIGVDYTQLIQPWMFGHLEQKGTCLWLYGLDELVPTNNVYKEMMKLPESERQKMFWMGPSEERANLRSKTYDGIAEAMAEQWTNPRQLNIMDFC